MRKLVGAAALLVAFLVGAAGFAHKQTVTRWRVTHPRDHAEVVYITNLAPRFIADREIRRSIPAWQAAINVDFAKYWHTTRYRLVFLGRKPAPPGHISAVFQDRGPVKGALAYHWTERGNAPSITVYAGTGAYYGFSNSVSFTHELEEMAADPVTSYVNVGYPTDYVWMQGKDGNPSYSYTPAIGWMSEVSDPVEADSYCRPGADGKCVRISDFVTPAWFADGVGDRFDFMGLCQQPYWLRPGGYAVYLTATGFDAVYNFRKGHPADAGFSKGEPRGSH